MLAATPATAACGSSPPRRTAHPRLGRREQVMLAALFGTAVIVWQITGDGEAIAFDGAALVVGLGNPGHDRGV